MSEDKLSKYGLRTTEDGYQVDGKSLLASIGGVQGLIENALPSFLYVLVFVIWKSIPIALWSVGIVIAALSVRHIFKRKPLIQLVGSFAGLGLAIWLTTRPGGQAKDYFIQGLITNVVYGSVFLLSVIVRWPIIGILVGIFTGQGTRWRADRRKVKFFDIVTMLWVGLFAIRLAVEVPLYLVGDIVMLGFMKLVLGLPFYLTMIWISWLLLRRVIQPAQDGNLDK